MNKKVNNKWDIGVTFEEGHGIIKEHKRVFNGTLNGVFRSLKEISKWGKVRKMVVEKSGEKGEKG